MTFLHAIVLPLVATISHRRPMADLHVLCVDCMQANALSLLSSLAERVASTSRTTAAIEEQQEGEEGDAISSQNKSYVYDTELDSEEGWEKP